MRITTYYHKYLLNFHKFNNPINTLADIVLNNIQIKLFRSTTGKF